MSRHYLSRAGAAVLSAVLLSAGSSAAQAGSVSSSCTFNGVPLYGTVQIVDHFPDFKIQKTAHFPDLKVQWGKNFPADCGQWQLVDSFPDFTVQFVDHFPDFKIQEVSRFPGL